MKQRLLDEIDENVGCVDLIKKILRGVDVYQQYNNNSYGSGIIYLSSLSLDDEEAQYAALHEIGHVLYNKIKNRKKMVNKTLSQLLNEGDQQFLKIEKIYDDLEIDRNYNTVLMEVAGFYDMSNEIGQHKYNYYSYFLPEKLLEECFASVFSYKFMGNEPSKRDLAILGKSIQMINEMVDEYINLVK